MGGGLLIRQHWVRVAGATLKALPFAVFVLVAAVLIAIFVPTGVSGVLVVLLGLLVALAIVALAGSGARLARANWRLTVADRQAILEEGITARNSTAIPLDRIQNVTTRQTPLGRLLDYGTVTIETAGHSPIFLTWIPNPDYVRDVLVSGRVPDIRHGSP